MSVTEFLKSFGLMLKATGLTMALILVAAAVFTVFERRKQRRIRQRKRGELARMLEGQPLEVALAASCYDYAHFQGQDGHRISEKGKVSGLVGSASTKLDAHLWIVEHYRPGSLQGLSKPKGDVQVQ